MNDGLSTRYEIWLDTNDENGRCYLFPKKTIITIGPKLLVNLWNKKKYVDPQQIQQYSCTKEEAHAFLRQQWDGALNESKKAWMQLYEFSKMIGLEQDMEAMKEGFLHGLKNSGADVNQAFDFGKDMVEQLQNAVKEEHNQSENEKQEAFKNVFKNLPEVLAFFDEDKLEEASKNPEEWGKELYQKVFGEIDKKKIEKRKEKLTSDIRASIANGLRNAGITPSVDFDKTNTGKNKK